MEYQRCKYCGRNKVWNVVYKMCKDCLKETAKEHNLDICDNCDGTAEACFCGNGLMKKQSEDKNER